MERAGDFADQRIPYPIARDYQEQNRVFGELLEYAITFAPMEIGGNTRVGEVHLVSTNYLASLGAIPVLGRTFLAEDNGSAGPSPVAVISHALWQSGFGGDATVVGKTLWLRPRYAAPQSCTIIGVAPAGFAGLEGAGPAVWLPSVMEEHFCRASSVNFRLAGRLASGVTRAQAAAALDIIARNVAAKYGGKPLPHYGNEGIFRSDLRTELRPVAVGRWGAFKSRHAVEQATLLAMAVVGLLFGIACANVSNLLLVRSVRRRREVAIRLALGASRWQVWRQLLAESLVLALLGSAAGWFVAHWLNQFLMASKPAGLTLIVETSVDYRVIGFTLLTALVAAMLFGTAPAWQATHFNLNAALRDDALTQRRMGLSLGDIFVVGQIGLCLLLLLGAGLCLRSFARLQFAEPGFNVQETSLLRVRAEGVAEGAVRSLYPGAVERLAALPGVRSVSYTQYFPMLSGGGASFPAGPLEGYIPKPNEFINVSFMEVGPNAFQTWGIPILLTEDDTPLGAEGTRAWINESFARRYWPTQSPLGKRIGAYRVHGVVSDAQLVSLTEPSAPSVFLQRAAPEGNAFAFLVRTEADTRLTMSTLQAALRSAHPNLVLSELLPMRQVLRRTLVGERFLLLLLGGFAATATLLASLGIYGVMSYSVSQRTRELGIRIALGAGRERVLGMVLRRGLALTAAGLAIGLAVAWATTRALSSVLHGVSPTDPWTFGAVMVLMMIVSLLACIVPASRAANVDPMSALRHE
jgi:predicted permease